MNFPNFVMWRSGYKEPTSTPMKDKYLGTVGKGRDFLRIPSEEIERALTKCAARIAELEARLSPLRGHFSRVTSLARWAAARLDVLHCHVRFGCATPA